MKNIYLKENKGDLHDSYAFKMTIEMKEKLKEISKHIEVARWLRSVIKENLPTLEKLYAEAKANKLDEIREVPEIKKVSPEPFKLKV